MVINSHNLKIAEHCSPVPVSGFLTNGLQFTKTGTLVTNRCYSIAISALQTSPNEHTGVISPDTARNISRNADDKSIDVNTSILPFIKGKTPNLIIPDKPVQFEMTLSANFLLTLATALSEFTGKEEDAIVRIRFTGPDDPVRLDARNTATGQSWEAFVMPRLSGGDAARFADPVVIPPPPPPAPFIVPPPPVEDLLARALAEAQRLMER